MRTKATAVALFACLSIAQGCALRGAGGAGQQLEADATRELYAFAQAAPKASTAIRAAAKVAQSFYDAGNLDKDNYVLILNVALASTRGIERALVAAEQVAGSSAVTRREVVRALLGSIRDGVPKDAPANPTLTLILAGIDGALLILDVVI